MSENPERRRIVVSLDQPKIVQTAVRSPAREVNPPSFLNQSGGDQLPQRRMWRKILLALGILLLLGAVAGAIGGYWWWTNLQRRPAYSLALLIDAARRDDKPKVEELLDTDAVVDNFVPQIVDKAKERYGRGLPAQTVNRAMQLLPAVLPVLKERAREEIPRLIREKAQAAPQSSPWVLAAGLERVSSVQETGDQAVVQIDLQNRQTEINLQRAGAGWKVVGLKDDALADKIAEDVAQRILAAATAQRQNGGQKQANKDLIEEIKKQIRAQQLAP